MPAPVIYHGGSGGVPAWPSAGGGAPSPSELLRECFLPASLWVPNASVNQDNPPYFEFVNLGGGLSEIFTRVLMFPRQQTGGSWAQVDYYCPSNIDAAAGTLDCSVVWSALGAVPAGPVSWSIHVTDGSPVAVYAGGGPGVNVGSVGVTNTPSHTVFVAVPPRRGAAVVPLVGGRVLSFNVYRADNEASVYRAGFMGLIVRYSILP